MLFYYRFYGEKMIPLYKTIDDICFKYSQISSLTYGEYPNHIYLYATFS